MSNITALQRQWEIIMLLTSTPNYLSSNDIKTHLATLGIVVDIRTIQRDLQELASRFPLDCNESDRPYSWRWKRLAGASQHTLTLEQALVFRFLETELQGYIPVALFDTLEPLFIKARLMIANETRQLNRFRPKHSPTPTHPRPTLLQKLLGKPSATQVALGELIEILDNLALKDFCRILKTVQA